MFANLFFGGGDPDVNAIIANMDSAPDSARITLIEALVKDLKNEGVWSKLDFLFVCAAHDQQAARLNWLDPSGLEATEYNSPTFSTDQGFRGNGSNMYLDTNVSPASLTHWTQSEACLGSYITAHFTTPGGYGIGTLTNSALAPGAANVQRREGYILGATAGKINGGPTLFAESPSIGVSVASGYALVQITGGVYSIYRDTTVIDTETSPSPSSPTTFNLSILRNTTSYDQDEYVGLVHGGASLTTSERAGAFNAFNTYINDL